MANIRPIAGNMNAQAATSKVNAGTILVAFFAILLGLAGTYAVRLALRKPEVAAPAEPPPPPQPERVTVPLASRDIESGTQITLDDIALYRMTRDEIKESIPASSFMTNPEQIIGKILLNDMKRGKTFDTRDFFPTGRSPGVAKRLKPGLRAMTIVLDATNALNGFAGPGQRVDVMFHYGEESSGDSANSKGGGFYPQHFDFNPPRRRDYYGNTTGAFDADALGGLQTATSTLIQDAEILALGKQSTPTDAASGLPQDEKVSVTLAVNPREAELLRVADGHGELSLTLRGPDDFERLKLVNPVTLDQIINVDSKQHRMEIYRGTQLSQMNFSFGKTISQRVFADDPPTDTANFPAVAPIGPATPVGFGGSVPFPSMLPIWIPNPVAPAVFPAAQNPLLEPPAKLSPPLIEGSPPRGAQQ